MLLSHAVWNFSCITTHHMWRITSSFIGFAAEIMSLQQIPSCTRRLRSQPRAVDRIGYMRVAARASLCTLEISSQSIQIQVAKRPRTVGPSCHKSAHLSAMSTSTTPRSGERRALEPWMNRTRRPRRTKRNSFKISDFSFRPILVSDRSLWLVVGNLHGMSESTAA